MLGGGHGALATAADLGSRGFEVRLALRNRPRFEALFATRHVRATGVLEAEAELALVTTDHGAAVRGADLVLVPLPAFAQETMADRIASALEPGQVVCLMPGTFGAYVVGRRLPGVVVAEMATLPYGARQIGQNEVGTALHAHHLPTGVYPATETERALDVIRRVYTQAVPVEDALAAALLNSNGALHAPLMVLNAGPIDRGPYDIHVDGTTPLVRRVIEAADGERMAVRQGFGYAQPHWPLADYYADADWFYGAGAYSSVQRRSVWREQLAFDHRYIVEDVAIGLVLWSALGRVLALATSVTDALIEISEALTGRDFRAEGRTLERLGLAGLTAAEIRERLQ